MRHNFKRDAQDAAEAKGKEYGGREEYWGTKVVNDVFPKIIGSNQ